ncbi:putative 3-hydroxybenzoate 6-monooxygenase [Helianthus debilis subsp. tardiflorus]
MCILACFYQAGHPFLMQPPSLYKYMHSQTYIHSDPHIESLFLSNISRAMDDDEVVIIGAGICGLATALALHRKGIKSVVMERSESLRNVTGTAIGIQPNGWRALDQLGVSENLRHTAVRLRRYLYLSLFLLMFIN